MLAFYQCRTKDNAVKVTIITASEQVNHQYAGKIVLLNRRRLSLFSPYQFLLINRENNSVRQMQLRLTQLANWVGLALLELVKAKHDFKRPALVVPSTHFKEVLRLGVRMTTVCSFLTKQV